MKKINLSNQQIQSIVTLYTKENKTSEEIGKILGFSQDKILKTLKENGVIANTLKRKLKEFEGKEKEIAEYKSKFGTNKTCLKYNIHYKFLNILLKRSGNFKSLGCKVKKSEYTNIINLYFNEKKTIKEISEIYNVSPVPIKRALKSQKMQNRTKKDYRSYFLNTDFFKTIDSHEKAYILGFLFADGYNNEKEGKVRIDLAICDKCLLEKINSYIQPNRKNSIKYIGAEQISRYKNAKKSTGVYYTVFYCKEMSEDLAKIGCYQAKSLTCELPEINKEFFNSFVAGYFDGDGCISFSYKKNRRKDTKYFNVNMCCSHIFAKQIAEKIKNMLDINVGIRLQGKISVVLIGGNKQILKFIRSYKILVVKY